MEPGARALSTMKPIPITFDRFPKLPPELRLRIWGHTIFPRVVNLIYDPQRDRYFSFNSTVPAILHACSESRAVGLKVESLKLAFGTKSHKANIYFDFARDILFFDDWMSPCLCDWPYFKTYRQSDGSLGWPQNIRYPEGPMASSEIENIERVAVNFSAYEQARTGVGLMLRRFPKMNTLLVVLESIPNHDELSYPASMDRADIRFIDIPTITTCELETSRLQSVNVYWAADQGRLKTVRGSHGMLNFSGDEASIDIVTTNPYWRDQGQLSVVRGVHGILEFSSSQAWIKSVPLCEAQADRAQENEIDFEMCRICDWKTTFDHLSKKPFKFRRRKPPATIPDIKLVAAFRGYSDESDFGCIIQPPEESLSDTSESESESDLMDFDSSDADSNSDSDTDSNSDSESDSSSESSDSDSGSETTSEIMQEILNIQALYASTRDLKEKITVLAKELSDLIEDEKKFVKFVGYMGPIETKSYWVGSDYLEKRGDLGLADTRGNYALRNEIDL